MNDKIASLLQQLMAHLQTVANDKKETGPGEWTFSSADKDLISKIGADAGMSESELSLLLQKMDNTGTLKLVDFLGALARNFKQQQDVQPITVPETELPLLETFLARMGVPVNDVKQVSENAVTGDGNLDLTKFLKGLDNIKAENATQLTGWETEQLQDMLAQAGVSKMLQRSLFPDERTGQPVNLTLNRLASMLQKGLQEIEATRPQPDLPAFLNDIKSILARSGFSEKGVGWTPVVQDSVGAVYKKLLESVDLSTMQVRKVVSASGEQTDLQKRILKPDMQKNVFGADGQALQEGENGSVIPAVVGQAVKVAVAKVLVGKDSPQLTDDVVKDQPEMLKQDSLLVGAGTQPDHAQTPGDGVKAPVPAARFTPAFQFQTFENITQSVVQGLKNNDHHLVLKLYPPDLGQVKVEMVVRNDHVAVSFAMENSRVKDIMESNMQQFQDNMQKHGFILQECMVSLGQRQDGGDAWQQFEQARQSMSSLSAGRSAILPDDDHLYYRAGTPVRSERDGVDLFA